MRLRRIQRNCSILLSKMLVLKPHNSLLRKRDYGFLHTDQKKQLLEFIPMDFNTVKSK